MNKRPLWQFLPWSHWWLNFDLFGYVFPQIHGRLYWWNRRRLASRHGSRRET